MTATIQARSTLAELNQNFRREDSTPDFETVTEYRVGKWGTRWSRDGYASRGVGGDKLHLSVVTVITAIKPDYDWQSYCASSVHVSPWATPEQTQQRRAQQVASHGSYGHSCRQPQVGDVLNVRPVCRHENVRGTAAWTPEEADTDRIDCINCRVQFFKEQVDGIEERRVERAAVEARKAAKPKPARCFWCGDIRPQTRATRAGEQLPCSYCKEHFETIFWVETTGYSNSYFAEMAETREPEHDARMRAMGIRDETEACEALERRAGKFFR